MTIRSVLSIAALIALMLGVACSDDDDPTGTTDTTPPGVTAVTPVDAFHIDISFSEEVTESSAEDDSHYLIIESGTPLVAGSLATPGDTVHVAAAVLRPDRQIVAITTEESMAGANFTLSVRGVSDTHGNQINTPVERLFTGSSAADDTPPQILTRTPAPGATGVSTVTPVTVQFSEPVNFAALGGVAWTAQTGPVPFSIVTDGGGCFEDCTVLMLVSSGALATNALQTVTLSGVQDFTGNTLIDTEWSFTTTGVADNTPPTLVSTSPANNAINVNVNTNLSLTFSEAVNQTSFNITLAPDPGDGDATWSNGGKTVTFNPAGPLLDDQQYTLTIYPGGVLDLAGNSIVGLHTRVFTTGAALESGSITGTIFGHPGSQAADPTGATVIAIDDVPFGGAFNILGSAIVAGNNTYTISHLADRQYYLLSVKDTNGDGNLEPGGGDAVGAYGVNFAFLDFEPDSVVVAGGAHVTGISFGLYDPSAVSGTVTYSGIYAEGNYYAYVGLFPEAGFDPQNPGEPVASGNAFWPGSPEWGINTLDPPLAMGDYYVGAFLDVIVNGGYDAGQEPAGLYGGINSPQTIHLMDGNDLEGLEIQLVDPVIPGNTSVTVVWPKPARHPWFQQLSEIARRGLTAN